MSCCQWSAVGKWLKDGASALFLYGLLGRLTELLVAQPLSFHFGSSRS